MKWKLVLILLAVGAGFGGVLLAPSTLVNPGKVSTGHSKIAGDCFRCHTVFLGPDDAKCTTCHRPAEIRVTGLRAVDFHAHLSGGQCTACHTEHAGPTPARTIRRFDHGLLTADRRAMCETCHERPRDSLHRAIVSGCASCHATAAWTPATFDHARYFRFDRNHPPDCLSCHIGGVYERYTCYGACHEHSEAKIIREHREEGIHDIANCTECHRSGDEDEAERVWKRKRRSKQDDD